MTSDATCVVCGRPLKLGGRRRLLCSKACANKRAKAQRRAWLRAHKQRMSEYWAGYHTKHRDERNAANLARYHKKRKVA